MALKSKLTEAEYTALPDALKEHYKKNGDGYFLDSDDATELREAKRREKERADELQRQLDAEKNAREEAERQRQEEAAEAARKAKDIPTIEASWQQKLDAANASNAEKLAAKDRQLEALLVDNQAIAIANEIGKSPAAAKLLLPHIKARLKAETDGDKAITRVLDADGKPSALTLVELREEFVANPDFGDIIKGSNASGGGAGSFDSGGGGATKKLSQMSEQERVKMARENPTEWARVKAAGG